MTYSDQCGREELARRNPDVPAEKIVEPDIICDCHTFGEVAGESFDFIIASHVIEHLDNPLRALLEWRRILRLGGHVVCVVPDGRFTFDSGRPFTTVEHLVWDFLHDGTELKQLSDLFHIAECNLNMHEGLTTSGAIALALEISATSNDTHFHVWSAETFPAHIEELRRAWRLPFRVAAHGSDDAFETVCVLEAIPPQAPIDQAEAAA